MTGVVVVDASVTVKWLVSEVPSEHAYALARSWAQERTQPVAPYLMPVEVANARHRRVLRRELLTYPQPPTLEERNRLETQFDILFATKTGYWTLDERFVLARAKKASLLMVLKHPEIPLHNNSAELAARQRLRKRKISFGPRVAEGTRARNTFMSLSALPRGSKE